MEYIPIYCPLDFMKAVHDFYKTNFRCENDICNEERVMFSGSGVNWDIRRIVLDEGFEIFLSNIKQIKSIYIPFEICYSAIDIDLYSEADNHKSIEAVYDLTFSNYFLKEQRRSEVLFPAINKSHVGIFMDCDFLSRYIDLKPFQERIQNKNMIHPWIESIPSSSVIYSIFKHIFEDGKYTHFPNLFYRSKAMEIISWCVDSIARNIGVGTSDENLSGENTLETIRRIIEEQCCTGITIDEISRKVYKSPSWIKTQYKQKFGTTVHQDIISRRMAKSALFITENNSSVEETARYAGYEHTGHFISSFKKHFGYTPGEYKSYKSL